MSFYIDKLYKNKEETPLTFHNFKRFVATPIGFVLNLATLININFDVDLDIGVLFENVILIIGLTFQLSFFIGSFKWKKYAWYSAIAMCVYTLIICFAYLFLIDSFNGVGLFCFLVVAVIKYLEFVYYKKRESLFNNETTRNFEGIIKDVNINNNRNNFANVIKISYCRKCGAKIDYDAIFCSKCGEKVSK